MIIATEEQISALHEDTRRALHALGLGSHRNGYRHLLILIPRYSLDNSQSMSKELYPFVAEHYGYSSWKPVEHAVRMAVLDAWKRRNPWVWERYFPGMKEPPSNKRFIATIAEQIKIAPPG